MLRPLLLSLLLSAASAQDILSALNGNSNFSSFAALLQQSSAASLVSQINAGNRTVLAPNNEAISAAQLTTANLNVDQLAYHVLSGSFPAASIPLGHSVVRSLSTNASLPNDQTQAVVLNKNAASTISVVQGLANATVLSSTQSDTITIHQLDKVLSLPASLSATAGAAGLSSFAVTVSTVLPGLIEGLEQLRGITVFAPVNSAFANLVGILSSIPTGSIPNVLANHVLNGTAVFSPSMANNTLSITASGEPIYYIQNATGTFAQTNYNTVKILIADVPILNGVVHVVDNILINPLSNPSALASAQSKESADLATQTATQTGFVTESLDVATTTAFPTRMRRWY